MRPRWPACVALALLTCGVPRLGAAQEFTPVVPLSASALGFLSAGLPPGDRSTRFETMALQWDGLPELGATAVALEGGAGYARLAAGVASAGSGELAWQALALAGGVTLPRAGAGVLVIGRREAALPRATGLAVGAGGWAEAAPHLRLWAGAPALWSSGAAPPLRQGLELGAIARTRAGHAWVALEQDRAWTAHRGGIALAAAPAGVWLEARDAPLRGAVGVWAAARSLCVAAAVESHPVLDPTVRLMVARTPPPW